MHRPRAFLAAMLYDTLGPALLAILAPDQFQSTLQLQVSFLRPVRPGRLVGQGRAVHRGGDLAYLEAHLRLTAGRLGLHATYGMEEQSGPDVERFR
jgi:acyl-coenzyme A thioesterase PaaI-like protein